jgi:hypothetical protein
MLLQNLEAFHSHLLDSPRRNVGTGGNIGPGGDVGTAGDVSPRTTLSSEASSSLVLEDTTSDTLSPSLL